MKNIKCSNSKKVCYACGYDAEDLVKQIVELEKKNDKLWTDLYNAENIVSYLQQQLADKDEELEYFSKRDEEKEKQLEKQAEFHRKSVLELKKQLHELLKKIVGEIKKQIYDDCFLKEYGNRRCDFNFIIKYLNLILEKYGGEDE